MKKVTIYKINCYEAAMMRETGERYSLAPWGKNTLDYKGEDDGGKEYILPDGCEVCENADGEKWIERNGELMLLIKGEGGPVLKGDGYFVGLVATENP